MKTKSTSSLAYLIVILGSLFYCYEYFLRVAPSVMAHEWMRDFNIDATMFGVLSGFYYYAYTPMQLFVGIIVDRFRVRQVLVLAILACVMGALLISVSTSYPVACMGRFLQGFGSAFAFVGTLKLVSVWLPGDKFALFSGLAGSLGFLGASVTQIVLAHILQQYTWQTCMDIFVVLGLLLSALFWSTSFFKKDDEILDSSVTSLKASFQNLWSIVKMPTVWMAGLYAAFLYLPTSVFAELWGIPYMEKFHGYSPEQAAIAVSMIDMGWALGSASLGWLSDIFRNRSILMRIGALIALILSALILYVHSLPFLLVCALFLIFGLVSAAETLSFVVARDLCHSNVMVGSAVAFVNTLTMVGGMIFQGGLGKILDLTWSGGMQDGLRVYSLHSYQIAISIVPISVLCAFLISLRVRESYRGN